MMCHLDPVPWKWRGQLGLIEKTTGFWESDLLLFAVVV